MGFHNGVHVKVKVYLVTLVTVETASLGKCMKGKWAILSTTLLAQFNKVEEGTQCDMSWWSDAELEKSSEKMPLVNEESSLHNKEIKGKVQELDIKLR